MPRNLEEKHWRVLLKRIKDGNCVPFLGGAMHRPGCIRPGCELAREWATLYGYPLDDKNDLARVARFVAIENDDDFFPREQIADQIRTAIPPDFTDPMEPHRVLADLDLRMYMTTNYDDFMFQALKATHRKEPQWECCHWHAGLRHEPSIFEAANVRINAANPLVYHFHGHVNELNSMVVSEDDYLDFLANLAEDKKLIPPLIQQTLAQSSLLFMGYRVYDWDFRVLFRSLAPFIKRSDIKRQEKVNVAVQLVPLSDDAQQDQITEAMNFLDKYFDDYDVRVFWGDCHQFAAESGGDGMSATCEAPREVVVEQPYVGPRPFERNDADKRRFFARDREAEEITALITAHPAVLLYATSGAGKTSLINTKLDSLLRDLPAEILPPPRVRLDADAVVSSEELEPGNIFISSVLHYWAGSDTRPGETLAGFLRRQDRPTGPDSETTIRVIILDQFEEIFTSSPEHWRHRRGFFEQIRDALEGSPTTLSPSEIRDPARLAERIAAGKTPIDAYIRDRLTREPRGRQVGGTGVATVLKPDTDTLVAGLNRIIQNAELCRGRRADRAPLTPEMLGFLQSNGSPRDMLRLNRKLLELAFPDEIVPCVEGDPSLRVLLAMREDYIAELDPYTALLPEQLQIRFRLERLREPAALRAVTGPLEVLEKQGGAAQFEAGAAEDLVRNLMGNDEFVEPVQLQVVCANLWEAVAQTGRNVIRNDDIKKYADVSEALLKYYEKCLAEAVGSDVREGELRRWFETKLITPAGTRGTVYKGTDHTEGIPNRPVEILDRLHLIKPEVRDGATWYELAHDRFIEPILTSNHVWRSRRSEQTLKALEEKARAWADARAQGQEGVGLLDEDELARAEAWLTTSDAVDLGPSETVRRFVQESRKAVEDDRKHREDEQRRDREAAKGASASTSTFTTSRSRQKPWPALSRRS